MINNNCGVETTFFGVKGIHLAERCRKCNKKFTKKRTPSMQVRALTMFENRWKYLCNDCALQTVYLWDNRND